MLTNKFGKMVAGITLSFTILMSGSMVIQTKAAHAASASTASAKAKATNIISSGERFMGVSYKYGVSTDTTKYFDCSSFTQHLYKAIGIDLPRTAKSQSKVGSYVPRSQLKPGDLVFFYSPIHHVGIYIGNGQILHTYGDPGVTISNLNSGWWDDHYTTARRVL